jgi:hypothetical protein
MATPDREGQFLPLNQIIDIQAIYDDESIEQDLKQILIRIGIAFNDYALAINAKDTGIYTTEEFVTGQVFFPNPTLNSTTALAPVPRQVFRIVVDFGTLPNTANKAVAHNITFDANTTFVRAYATATDSVGFNAIPIPMQFVASANKVDLRVDATNVNIQTNFNATAFTKCPVVIEYIQQ